MPSLLDAAIEYVTVYNWFIFPIEPRSKKPATAHGFKDASNDPDVILSWWKQQPALNIGVDCGRSNLAVVDVDAEGMEAWNDLANTMAYRAAMVAYTGGGGAHLIYKQPATFEVKNTASKLAKGIDTRGEGGYILLAPSIHPNGNAYAWADGQSLFDTMETFPPELIALLKDSPPTPPTNGQPPRNMTRALQKSYERVANAAHGTRNDTLNKAAYWLFGLAKNGEVNETEVRDTLTAAAQRAGLDEREIIATIGSAYRAATA